MKAIRRWLGVSVFAGIAASPALAQACPNCGRGLDEHGLALGYAWSIALMAGAPFAMLLAWSIAVSWLICRARPCREKPRGVERRA